MRWTGWVFAWLICWVQGHAISPESQIIIIENFITSEASKELIDFYCKEPKTLSASSDNQIVFSYSTNPHIRQMVSEISKRILEVMRRQYGFQKNYQVDHCAMYARIRGNYCPYHSDNISFYCPIHGTDQGRLRTTCDGTCPGARYIPNHTPWREYTALLYLNDQFKGGEIAFEDGPCNKIYKKVIPIQANMLVIAPNGPDYYHEVFPMRQGTRYSMHFWYTSDAKHFNSLFRVNP